MEVHIDILANYDSSNENSLTDLPLGGNVSVRKPPNAKPIVVFGQDEAIFRSTCLNQSGWTLDGETTLRSKGTGKGFMVSALCSREFGFGFPLTEEQLAQVNEARAGKNYVDEQAATYLNGSSLKPKKLACSPFIRFIEYGSGKDGYWTYNHMVLQLEDCIDCLKVVLVDFDIAFELDQSSGHAHNRPDGRNLSNMSMKWGGRQKNMHESILTANVQYADF